MSDGMTDLQSRYHFYEGGGYSGVDSGQGAGGSMPDDQYDPTDSEYSDDSASYDDSGSTDTVDPGQGEDLALDTSTNSQDENAYAGVTDPPPTEENLGYDPNAEIPGTGGYSANQLLEGGWTQEEVDSYMNQPAAPGSSWTNADLTNAGWTQQDFENLQDQVYNHGANPDAIIEGWASSFSGDVGRGSAGSAQTTSGSQRSSSSGGGSGSGGGSSLGSGGGGGGGKATPPPSSSNTATNSTLNSLLGSFAKIGSSLTSLLKTSTTKSQALLGSRLNTAKRTTAQVGSTDMTTLVIVGVVIAIAALLNHGRSEE